MTLTVAITPAELQRQAAACFEGLSYRIFLAYDPSATLDLTATTAEWEDLEVDEANGYESVTGTIDVGSYNSSFGRYEIPPITCQFTGTGAGYSYDVIVLVVDNATYPHSVTRLSQFVALQSGQVKSYIFSLRQDD